MVRLGLPSGTSLTPLGEDRRRGGPFDGGAPYHVLRFSPHRIACLPPHGCHRRVATDSALRSGAGVAGVAGEAGEAGGAAKGGACGLV